MHTRVRYRDSRQEARERERFRVLEAVHAAVRGDPGQAVLCSTLADRLGLARTEAAAILGELVRAGLLGEAAGGPAVSLTRAGAAYVEWIAGRRRSVRLGRGRRAA